MVSVFIAFGFWLSTYRGFHITFEERVPKFVRNFRSWQRTWQFDYVVTNQVGNFAAKFEITTRTSQLQFGKFAEGWGELWILSPDKVKLYQTMCGKKVYMTGYKTKGQQKSEKSWNSTNRPSIVDNFVRKGHVEAGKGGNKIRSARIDDVIYYAEYCKQTLTCL